MNREIAARSKSDLAFRMHHLTWISAIRRENLAIDPKNNNSEQQICNDFFYQMQKAKYSKSEALRKESQKGFWQKVNEFFVLEIKEKGENHGV